MSSLLDNVLALIIGVDLQNSSVLCSVYYIMLSYMHTHMSSSYSLWFRLKYLFIVNWGQLFEFFLCFLYI